MRTCNGWPIGVCSWSFHGSLDELDEAMKQTGIEHVHLAVGPALADNGAAYLDAVREKDWTVTSTMIGFPQESYKTLDTIRETGGIVPDDVWPRNRERVLHAITATVEIGAPYLSMHAGFLDYSDKAYAQKLGGRLHELADAAAEADIKLILETGQESAADLHGYMEELNHPGLGINFDPANMILYDKDEPCDAVRLLGPWILHLHIKDAIRTTTPGQWGKEVAWGEGQVGGSAFIAVLKEVGFSGALAIEREAGANRMGDVEMALARLMAAEQS